MAMAFAIVKGNAIVIMDLMKQITAVLALKISTTIQLVHVLFFYLSFLLTMTKANVYN